MHYDTTAPKISVITPSLNQGRYLRQSIESVFNQGYANLELIIVDGGSSDESIAIIEEYEDRIAYWVSEKDEGQSDALNKGFQKSTGDVVAWLNADDYYLPGAFHEFQKVYLTNPVAPFYFGDGLRVDEAGCFISSFFPEGTLRFNRHALVLGLNYILQPSTFINRAHLERVGYLDTSLHYGMDSDLWLRLSHAENPAVIPAGIAASREYASTKTASGSFKRIEELRQISSRHSGMDITPGVLCYLMDTLHRYAAQNDEIFPGSYLSDIETFWQKTAQLLDLVDARPDGFPKPDCKPPTIQSWLRKFLK